MDQTPDRIATAQWILERQLHWIAAAEVKVGVIITINISMLGALAAAYSSLQDKTTWIVVMSLLSAGLSSVAVFCSALAISPRLKGPTQSLLFFGQIAAASEADYCNQLQSASAETLLRDWSTQIHRNAQIARDKHSWVSCGMNWSLGAAPAWAAAIALIVKV